MYLYDLSDYIGIEITGPDTEDWLNRVLSNQIPNEKKCFGAAILDYKANPKMIFFCEKIGENHYRLICERALKDQAMQILEDGVFAEDLSLSLNETLDNYIVVESLSVSSAEDKCLFVNDRFAVFLEGSDFIREKSYKKINSSEFYNLRLLLGIPGIDIMANHIIIESESYLNFVSDDKGCYPGQEVVNKILSIGQVPKKLLVLQTDILISAEQSLSFTDGKVLKEFQAFEFDGAFYLTSFVRTKLVQEMSNQVRLIVSGEEIICHRVY